MNVYKDIRVRGSESSSCFLGLELKCVIAPKLILTPGDTAFPVEMLRRYKTWWCVLQALESSGMICILRMFLFFFFFFKEQIEPGVVAHTFNLRTREVEVGRSM